MNARENPFRTECVHRVRYRFVDGTWDGLMARLKKLDCRAALVGPDGSGKTTLLDELAPRLERLGFRVHRFFPQRVPAKGACHPLGAYQRAHAWVMPSL